MTISARHVVEQASVDPGSFRDRTARVFHFGGTVYRGLTPEAWDEWQLVFASQFFRQAMARGDMVETAVAPSSAARLFEAGAWAGILVHRRLPFISYPYEWPFGMLKEAASLHLRLLLEGLEEGFVLKDATPFNVQWQGCVATFIDVASFVRWRAGTPWAGYRQFCQLMLYPLMLQAYRGAPFQPWLRGRLDGMTADECRKLLSPRDVFRRGVLAHVIAQARLQRAFAHSAADVKRQVSAAGFGKAIITATARRLQRVVDGLQWEPGRSTWSDYATDHSYDEEALRTKELFVERAVQQHRGLVWDLGCNTGRFSLLASRYADYVVSVDSDAGSIERLYRRLSSEQHRKILPLTLDVTDLSPSLGWHGQERRAFVDRGQPDLVLCLALVHHLAITANIPVVDLVRWFHSLSAALVVEFPLPTDLMVKRLMATRDQCYDDYTVACFESALESHFAVRDRVVLHHGSRVLYYAVPRMDVGRPDRAGDRAKDA